MRTTPGQAHGTAPPEGPGAQAAHHAAAAALRVLDEVSPDALLVVDADDRPLFANDRFLSLWELPPPGPDCHCDDWMHPVWGRLVDAEAVKARTASYRGDFTSRGHDEVRLRDGRVLERFTSGLTAEDGSVIGRVWCYRDVTDRHRSQQALHREHTLLSGVLSTSVSAIIVRDATGALIFANRRATEMLGVSSEDFRYSDTTVTALRATHPDGRALLPTGGPFQQVLTGGAAVSDVRVTVRRPPEGERRELSFNAAPLFDDDGTLREVVMSIQDVTERERAAERLARREAQFRLLAENASDVIGRYALDGTCRYLSPSSERVFGWTPAELIGRRVGDLCHPEDQQRLAAHMDDVATGRDVPSLRYRMRRRDRSWIWVESSARLVVDGDEPEFIAITRDVSQRIADQTAMESSNRRLTGIASVLTEGVYVVDRNARIIFANPAAAELLGYEADDLIGLHSHDTFHAHRPDGHDHAFEDCPVHAALRGRTQANHDDLFRRRDGTWLPVAMASAPLTEHGTVVGAVTAFHDITERKNTERLMARSAQELKRSNEDLEQFAYAISHDLQEPLRMIASYLRLIERRYEPLLDDTGREFLHFAVDGAKRMQGMIVDLLEYSRIDRRGAPFTAVDTAAAAALAVQNLTVQIEETGAEVTLGALPPCHGDAGQIVRLFQNLIGNAVKYHAPDRPPRVTVGGWLRPDGRVALAVTDNGVGIEPRHRERVFAIFQRLHDGSVPGNGVGLALCRRIVERHGGTIGVESEPGQGSTFSFDLPTRAEPED